MKPQVAVVGSGPSGMYAADALAEHGAKVDVFDKLPVPFGLVRYGVAPDHVSIRSVRDTLDKIWDNDNIRFVGNVDVGTDISVEELREAYDAVILTYGASADRRLGIEGEDLEGSVAATDFVAWYTGHPAYAGPDFESLLSQVRSVAVIGVGNVAVDVVRVLSKSPQELSATDMPDHVLAALAAAPVEHVHLIGRRGPVQASFTTKELKELGELHDCDVHVRPEDLDLDPTSQAELEASKVAARNLTVLREWSERAPRAGVSGRIDLHFFTRPTRIVGTDKVEALELERTAFDDNGRLVATGESTRIDVDLVVRSVGYRGRPLGSVPFDEDRGVIPNLDGRVLVGDQPVPGLYVAGWIKRGPTGIIGTNKKCAVGTVASLLADIEAGAIAVTDRTGEADFVEGLASGGVAVVSTPGWRAVDAEERKRGGERGKDRLTIHEHDELLAIAGR